MQDSKGGGLTCCAGRRYAPLAFTEQGAIQVATILNSPRAAEISVHEERKK